MLVVGVSFYAPNYKHDTRWNQQMASAGLAVFVMGIIFLAFQLNGISIQL